MKNQIKHKKFTNYLIKCCYNFFHVFMVIISGGLWLIVILGKMLLKKHDKKVISKWEKNGLC